MKIGQTLMAIGMVLAVGHLSRAEEPEKNIKRGWAGGKPDTAKLMQCSWFYDWSLHGKSHGDLEFVPMVKTKHAVTEKHLHSVKQSGAKTLLGFNEPERANQGDTTVIEALELWPKLMATGLRLGSPAPSSDHDGMQWLEKFMEGVEKQKLRVDFIAVHYYQSDDVKKFEQWLDNLHKRYNRPIWVTEFNGKFAKGDDEKFARQAFDMLAKKSIVERYAYMNGFSPGQPGALFQDGDHTPSKLGEHFRSN